MANADFSKQSSTQGPRGFDSGSYREAKRADEDALHLTPAQQKLAVLENRLPTVLRNRGAALALSIVMMLAAFFGLGGAKLKTPISLVSGNVSCLFLFLLLLRSHYVLSLPV